MPFLYTAISFVAAFLLFAIQPMMGKFILPMFGGSSSVWIGCLLFFQGTLLGGYLIAYLVRHFSPRRQALFYLVLGLLSGGMWLAQWNGFFGPTQPDLTHPLIQVLWVLTKTALLPSLLLSSTSILIQGWLGEIPPYRIYSYSNAGSLLGLLSYPFLMEPLATLHTQTVGWGIVLLVLLGMVALLSRALPTVPPVGNAPVKQNSFPTRKAIGWLVYSFLSCVTLLGISSHITMDIASVPLLWVLPLAAYLLSFMIAFTGKCWRIPGWAGGATLMLLMPLVISFPMIDRGGDLLLVNLFFAHLLLFLACLFAHLELYELRPGKDRLHLFYLLIAVGGFLGGIFVNLICPYIFNVYAEGPMAVMLITVLLISRWAFSRLPTMGNIVVRVVFTTYFFSTVALTLIFTFWYILAAGDRGVFATRTFFGTYLVIDRDGIVFSPQARRDSGNSDKGETRSLQHGTTIHGTVLLDPKYYRWSSYYSEDNGLGQAIYFVRREGPLRIGAVGLGSGALASQLNMAEKMTYFEIDPVVEKIAQKYFPHLRTTSGEVKVSIEDGRIGLKNSPPDSYNLIVLDAFSSDAIPVHLLTVEAFRQYSKCLAPHGIIAIHITNRYLNLKNVVAAAGREMGRKVFWIRQDILAPKEMRKEPATFYGPWRKPVEAASIFNSEWIVMVEPDQAKSFMESVWDRYPNDNREVTLNGLTRIDLGYATDSIREIQNSIPPWTDQYSSILPTLALFR